ncbi:dihydroorotase [Vreelandella utahensis]|uniref:dihydroorotase n=1 Tax=Vreelandella halophila TaxID=86177 RepID=UPI001C4DFE79|nr:dihydroorotase [Halomonas utahensis]
MKWRVDNIHPVIDGEPSANPTSVLVVDGRIAALGADFSGERVEREVDGAGQWLLPGLIDLNCHLPEPGSDRGGSIESETRAAARGGFTTVCTTPDTSPINDSGAVTHLILDVAERNGHTRVLPVGALTRGLEGERLSDMAGLTRAGCVALGNGGHTTASSRVLRRCMAYAHTFGVRLFLQPENASLASDGCAHDGLVAARLGLPGIPEVAETTAVNELLMLAEETGANLHIGPLSCARSVTLVRAAKEAGHNVTAEVGIAHLEATEAAIEGYNGTFHSRPPLRTEADRRALLEGVESGVIDAIVSQHRPSDKAAKLAPFPETQPGLSTVESTLSLGLERVAAGELSRRALLRALTCGPARVLGLEAPTIAEDRVADLTLVAPEQHWMPAARSLYSAGPHLPVMERELPGVVMLTAVDGRIRHEHKGDGS